MAKRIGGFRRRTRHKFQKSIRTKGKISIGAFFQTFKEGERVYLSVEPAIHKGMYHPRFMGNSGIITGKQGDCYKIAYKDRTRAKTLIAHPIHLKRIA